MSLGLTDPHMHRYRHTHTHTHAHTHAHTHVHTHAHAHTHTLAHAHVHAHAHTHRCTNQSNFKKPGVRGLQPCTPGLKSLISKALVYKAFLKFKKTCMHCYSFLSDEYLFMYVPFDIIVHIFKDIIIMVVDYYSTYVI